MLLSVLLLSGCNGQRLREPVIDSEGHLARVPAGVAITMPKAGWWLSDELFSRLMEKLEDLQYRLDSMPKANSNTLPADSGQNPDDSARLLGSMANNPDGDYHEPQPRYQAETVGNVSAMDGNAVGRYTVTRGAGLQSLSATSGKSTPADDGCRREKDGEK